MKKFSLSFKKLIFLPLLALLSVGNARTFYWDEPQPLTSRNSQFPLVASNGNDSYLFFEEVEKSSASSGKIWISLVDESAESKKVPLARRIAGPFSYSGDIPDLYSAAVAKSGKIAVAVQVSQREVSVFTSTDGGATFSENRVPGARGLVGPRIFTSSNGSFVLFVSSSSGNDEFSILYTVSKDGSSWASPDPFPGSASVPNAFVPNLCPAGSNDVVVFQSKYEYGANKIPMPLKDTRLYATISFDKLKNWSLPVLVTGEDSFEEYSKENFTDYSNQQPSLYYDGKNLHLAWERNSVNSESSSIWTAELNPRSGRISGEVSRITKSGSARRPVFYEYEGALNLVWFDDRTGVNSVYRAEYNDPNWIESTVSSEKNPAWFAWPYIRKSGKSSLLSFVWQQESAKGEDSTARIFALLPDRHSNPPSFKPVNFTEGKKSSLENVSVNLSVPSDPSGIEGFTWIWTQNPDEEPPEDERNLRLPSEHTLTGKAPGDGKWYFKAKVLDRAGNWSESSSIAYTRDMTPPLAPVILDESLRRDEYGFLDSNAFSVSWKADESDDDVSGYSYSLVKIADLPKSLADSKRHPLKGDGEKIEAAVRKLLGDEDKLKESVPLPARFSSGGKTSASYSGFKNGLYAFSVRAFDEVGNAGPKSTVLVLLNKFEPETKISGIASSADDFGKISVSIYGEGFKYDGTVDEIYIRKSGKGEETEENSRVLRLADGDYSVDSDSKISRISLEDLDEGVYSIFLHHSDRGTYPKKSLEWTSFTVDESGTVKIQKPYQLHPVWTLNPREEKVTVNPVDLILALIFILAALVFALCARGILVTIRENILVKSEVAALLSGEIMPLERKEKAAALKKKGLSLKWKLSSFTSGLVAAVVLMVSIPLGRNMVKSQEQTLAENLQERVDAYMAGINSGVRSAFQSQDTLSLADLPGQIQYFEDAAYVTILGPAENSGDSALNYVWSSNDSEIEKRLESQPAAGTAYIQGESRLSEREKGSVIAEKLHALENDSEIQSLRQMDNAKELSPKAVNDSLNKISAVKSGAEPEFDNTKLNRENTDYLFYKPVLYRTNGDQNYVHAVILMQVSTTNLIKAVDDASRAIMIITVIIAVIAIVMGFFGAFVLASIIVKPIRLLVDHVNKIGATADKKKLKGETISVTSRDEIGVLGDAVNEMTAGLVHAAEAEEEAQIQQKMALDGKAVQQTFLPLLQSDKGGKRTTAELKEKNTEFFGYYEGADEVSGDYFDWKKLDDRRYAIIKCDASGHGVPAALIMTIVATLFRKYFENWSWASHGADLNKLVTQINDFIESLGIKGKFATLMVCIFDTQTGDVFMCNAGDNIIHVYDSALKREKVITLHEAPAAGPLPSFMVEMKGGFKVEKLNLKHGDVLFLYTDGIEEAKRFFRDSNFQVVKCAEPGMSEGEIHVNHKVGEDSEQMEPERVQAIIEAVFAKSQYKLVKYHSPNPAEELIFDFSGLDGSVEDVITALAAVEKVFRLYKTPSAKGTAQIQKDEDGEEHTIVTGDVVRVDRKIDAFLKKTFNLYDYYCSKQGDIGEANYLYYTDINADPQADDLTLLAVKRL